MSYIYKIYNDINDKVYIGKTNYLLEKRFQEHIRDSRKNQENRPLYNAMNKYGVEHFKIEQIEKCDVQIADEREKYWIELLQTFKYGYNATLGGDGKSYLDYELIYATYLETNSVKETALIVSCDEKSVSTILDIYGITKEDRIKNMALKKSNIVAMIDKKTNKIIKVFNGTREAGRFLNKTHQHIQEVCQGKRKSAYGYLWKYI